MKKLLLGSAALIIFAIAITLFQTSCKKDAIAQTPSNYTLPPATTSTLGGVIVGSGLSVTGNGTLSVNSATGSLTQLNKIVYTIYINATNQTEIWIANSDGTNKSKINITMPAGLSVAIGTETKLSPDGQTLFFVAETNATPHMGHIYACNANGTNVRLIIDGAGTDSKNLSIQGSY